MADRYVILVCLLIGKLRVMMKRFLFDKVKSSDYHTFLTYHYYHTLCPSGLKIRVEIGWIGIIAINEYADATDIRKNKQTDRK